MHPEHSIEREFALTCLTQYLQEFPERAAILAANYYEDYSNLADDYKALRRDFETLQQENMRLKSKHTHQPVSLPAFLDRQ